MYTCIHICIRVYTYVHIYIYMHIHLYAYGCTSIHKASPPLPYAMEAAIDIYMGIHVYVCVDHDEKACLGHEYMCAHDFADRSGPLGKAAFLFNVHRSCSGRLGKAPRVGLWARPCSCVVGHRQPVGPGCLPSIGCGSGGKTHEKIAPACSC